MAESTMGDFLRRLTHLAIPISIQMVLFNLLSLTDVLMLGVYGEQQVAAAGLASRVIFVTVIVLVGVNAGASILGAQYFGAQNYSGLRRAYAMAMAIGFAIMLPIAVLFLVFPNFLTQLASSDEVMLGYSGDYLRIVGPTVLISAVVITLENAMRTIHKTAAPTWISAGAIVTNILFNWLLIFGVGPFPEMQIVGAAWATLFGRIVHLGLALYFAYKVYPVLAIKKPDFAVLKDRLALKKFAKLSTPLIVNEALWVGGIFAYNIIYGRMGTEELAVVNMLAPFEGVLLSFFIGAAIAASIMVGNDLGANNFEGARLNAKRLLLVFPALGALVGLLLIACMPLLELFYSGVSESTMALAKSLLIMMGLIMWSKVWNMCCMLGVLRAGGDNNFVLYAEVITMWFVGVPLAALMAFVWQFSLPIVFLATFVEELLKGIAAFWRYRGEKWLANLVEDDTPSNRAESSSETFLG
ncbi:MATE family efflux transporter [Salinibius halmophilus]|uniref:MATE family efflux transporter n=1 Tax=Salinibius halmophilus TaxID=1853216 RepID=UPI000E669454|nr:MATE family efflux transporter [Salinibius halmophilus]